MCENIQTGIKGHKKEKRGNSAGSDVDSHSFLLHALFLQQNPFLHSHWGERDQL